jgi:hypothetical protein
VSDIQYESYSHDHRMLVKRFVDQNVFIADALKQYWNITVHCSIIYLESFDNGLSKKNINLNVYISQENILWYDDQCFYWMHIILQDFYNMLMYDICFYPINICLPAKLFFDSFTWLKYMCRVISLNFL